MAEWGDVAGTLADGLPAVEVMCEYLRACRQLGYPGPEPTGVRADYLAEEGMDLRALDADCRALWVAAGAAEEALRQQDAARMSVLAAWQGAGAESAGDFLRHNRDSSQAAVAALRGAASVLDELRDRLWQLVDAKVGTALAVEATVQGMRTAWLDAARTVSAGAGDRVSASELVANQVAPFVAGDIGEWVTTMRSTAAAVRQAYDTAGATIAGQPPAVFGVPGQLGSVPASGVTESDYLGGPAQYGQPSAATVPAGYSAAPVPAVGASSAPAGSPAWPGAAPGPWPGAAPGPWPGAAPEPWPQPGPGSPPPFGVGPGAAESGAAEPTAAAAPSVPLGGTGGGMAAPASGLSGWGQSLSDLVSGLLGSGGDSLSGGLEAPGDMDTAGVEPGDDLDEDPVEEPADESEESEEDPEDLEDPEDAEDPVDPEGSGDEDVDQDPVADAEAEPPVEAVEEQPPAPTPVPEPPVDIASVPVPEAAPLPPMTPCEIAADELPQAGPEAGVP